MLITQGMLLSTKENAADQQITFETPFPSTSSATIWSQSANAAPREKNVSRFETSTESFPDHEKIADINMVAIATVLGLIVLVLLTKEKR